MWVYEQASGHLFHSDILIGTGYAGGNLAPHHDPSAVNNPARQSEHCIGPLPSGNYTIGAACNHPQLGPVAMPLTPNPANTMFGRAAFFIHADSIAHPGQASEGCIVMPPNVRTQVANSLDRALQVVAHIARG